MIEKDEARQPGSPGSFFGTCAPLPYSNDYLARLPSPLNRVEQTLVSLPCANQVYSHLPSQNRCSKGQQARMSVGNRCVANNRLSRSLGDQPMQRYA